MLDQNVVKRLTVIASEQGLTSLNTKLAQTNRLYDQGTASAARYATATGNLDRHMQALLRQRDRYASAFNAGGIGGVAGRAGADAGMFAVSRVLPFTAAVGAAAVAVAGLNALFEHGAGLVEKYANAQRDVDRSDLVSNLEALTKFQGDTISAAQVQYATELGNRLADAKFTINEFFKVQLNLTDAALNLQGAWVGIVEQIAKGVGLIKRINNSDFVTWFNKFLESKGYSYDDLPASMKVSDKELLAAASRKTGASAQELAAASSKLGSALGVAAINKPGANIGDSFAANFNDGNYQLGEMHKRLHGVGEKGREAATATRTAWDRALDSISKSIALQEAEAQGVGATAGQMARLKVEAQLVEAGLRSGMTESAVKASEAYQRLGERAERAADSLARLKLVNELQFERDQLGRSDIDQKIASRLKSAGLEVNLNSLEAEMIRVNEQLKLGKELVSDFASGFVRDMMNGVSATEALGNALKRLGDKLVDMAMNNAVNALFGGLLNGALGGGGKALGGTGPQVFMGGTGVNPWMSGSPWGAVVAHSGGVIGSSALPTRFIHPAYFDNAPRYHGGGIAGLRPDEVPAILQKGETVLPRGGAPTTKIEIINRTSERVRAREGGSRQEGGVDIKTIVIEPILEDLATNGPVARMLENTHGLRRRV